jgi:hypothetical protein
MYVDTVVKETKISIHKVHPLYEPRYFITCVGKLTQRKSCISISEFLTRVEAGSNTSTVTLRVVRGDKMGLKKAAP